jgi:hypothetical protein
MLQTPNNPVAAYLASRLPNLHEEVVKRVDDASQ